MKITWLGHAAFLLENDKKVVIDPFITGNPLCPMNVDEIEADVIAVTHGHGDHLGDAVEIAKMNDAPIVCIHELSRILTRKGVEAVGMNIGGTSRVRGVRFTMTPAWHSSDVEEDDTIISAGMPAGIIVEMDSKVYHTGDTDVFLDMQLIGELHEPSVMLTPIGDWYTMGIKGAIKALELVKPKVAIPMHYNTFPVIKQDPEEFKRIAEEKLDVKVVVLKPGESYEY